MSYCSPSQKKVYEKTGTCFTRDALQRLAIAWNQENPDKPIRNIRKMGSKALWNALNLGMSSLCEPGAEHCWVDKLKPGPRVASKLRPMTPREWYKDDRTWLSNYDIKKVMDQYQDEPSYRYGFLGVFPIDFAGDPSEDTSPQAFSQCIYQEMCTLVNVANRLKRMRRKYDFLGFITNLDRHDEPGSHWTSTFICINPRLPAYGAYYYDSVARTPPPQIKAWIEGLQARLEELDKSARPLHPFTKLYSSCRMQYKNTECGVFSMAFQIRWIEMLRADRQTVFDDVMKMKGRLDDDTVHALRKILFRPNTNLPAVRSQPRQRKKRAPEQA